MSDIEIKAAKRLHGCDGQHYIVLGEVIDLYVMPRVLGFQLFAYEDRDCFYVGLTSATHEAALNQFVHEHYGKAVQWSKAA